MSPRRTSPRVTEKEAATARELKATKEARAPSRRFTQGQTGLIPRAFDLGRAVHDHHDRAHAPVQADAARLC